MSDLRPFGMPPQSTGFDIRAGWLVNKLLAETSLGLVNPIHPAAIVGNLGGESGLAAINEKHPTEPGSLGGWSWAQWTGMRPGGRRLAFNQFAQARGLALDSDQAAYEFLVHELLSSEARSLQQLKKTTTLEAATETFMLLFERPGDPQGALPSRIEFAKRALATASRGPSQEPTPTAAPAKDLANAHMTTLIRALQENLALEGLYPEEEIDGIPGPKTFTAMADYWRQREAK